MSRKSAFVTVQCKGREVRLPVVFLEIAELRDKKARDYRQSKQASLADYFPFGLISHTQMIWTKALRLMNLVSTQRKPNNESIRDTLKDLVNYATFAIEDLDGILEGRDIKEDK